MHEALNNWGGMLCTYGRQLCASGNQTAGQAQFEEGRGKCLEAERILPGAGAYNLACIEALSGQAGPALEWLEKAIEYRPARASHARTDPDLKSLHGNSRFRELTGPPVPSGG